MIGFRPRTNALFLERPRLLRLLPEEAGYVVWLEAPYGYGKSVLTSQWAAQLEAQGWRVIWLALVESEPRAALAQVLGLPGDTPWPILLEELGRHPSLVILEDLEGSPNLSPLLKHNPGLVLLASRSKLSDPELPRLMSEGRLMHLKANQLAFTQEEAAHLFPDPEQARQAWEKTGGWSLPLHLAALTGEVPESIASGALLEGVRESLSEPEWEEALFLSALPYLPKDKAQPQTLRLSEAGFVQALEAGYRLHPMAADSLLAVYPQQVRAALSRQAWRLDGLMRGQAFEKLGLLDALADLLEHAPELSLHDPQAVLHWDQLAPGERGRGRLALVGDALCSLGHTAEGLPMLLQAARFGGASPEESVAAFRDAIWWLAESDLEQAKAVALEAEPLLSQVSPVSAARLLNNASRIYFQAKEYPTAEAMVRRALALLPPEHPRRWPLLLNLGILRWNHFGDLQTRIQTAEEALQKGREFIAQRTAVALVDLGRYKWLLGERQAALAHWQEAQHNALPQPWDGLEAAALQAIYAQRFEALPGLLGKIKDWERGFVYNRVVAFWALELVNLGQAQRALEALQQAPDSELILSRAVRALALDKAGQRQAALAALEPQPTQRDREQALHWYAARYRISRLESDLEALLALTAWGQRVLPGLVPLAELPRTRPELAATYPLSQVLQSGWKEAIALRLEEIPPLEVRVLGQFRVYRMGQELNLTLRPRDILLLLLLGQSRQAIAEALWPGLEEGRARNNFFVNLNQLRKTLEPWGVSTYLGENGLQHTKSDLWELEQALKQQDLARVHELYQGPLAPDLDLPALEQARENLHQRVIETALRIARRASLPEAEQSLEWVLRLEPLHEEALQELLQVLLRSGRRTTALRHYQAFCRRLQDELGLEPRPETQQLLTR